MIYEFRLPDIGEGVVEGEVVRWLVKEGDALRMDQPMVEIMTDKATVEIPAPRAGRVGKRMFAEGQLCPVGKVLITIELDEGAADAGAAPAAKKSAGAAPVGTAAFRDGRSTGPRPTLSAAPAGGATPLSPAAGALALRPVPATAPTRTLAPQL